MTSLGRLLKSLKLNIMGKKSFFIEIGKDGKEETKFFKLKDEVLKPDDRVLKLNAENEVESRLSTLESKIEELNKLILKNYNHNPSKSQKEDGLDRIRTGDLRRVKAMS